MKRFILLIILSVILGSLHSFAQYQVNCIDSNGETMTFRVVGYGKNAKVASKNAELNVINNGSVIKCYAAEPIYVATRRSSPEICFLVSLILPISIIFKAKIVSEMAFFN